MSRGVTLTSMEAKSVFDWLSDRGFAELEASDEEE